MGASIPLVEGFAHIETKKIDGTPRYRWSCSCRRVLDKDLRKGSWLRSPWSVIEAFRQHWENVHPGHRTFDSGDAYEKVKRLTEICGDDEGRFWVAPSGKRPAVASDYYAEKRDLFAQLYGAKVTVKIPKVEESKGMSRLSDIQKRMRDLEKEAARYARFPAVDTYPVGTVITYEWSPKPNDQAQLYTYAVLKAGNEMWYWTGSWREPNKSGDYDALVEALAEVNVSNIGVALPDDFKPLFSEATGTEE